MENNEKVMGLDGKLYEQIKPSEENDQMKESVVNLKKKVQKAKENVKTGMIMDELEDVKLDENNSRTIDQFDNPVTGKLDENTLQKLMAYRNRKPSIREYKIGRNDPCPCGSGKKYKNCCLKTGKYEQLIKKG